jgi:signal peptidase I
MYLPADKRYDKPIDKKTNYVKRCVGIPGDSLQIKDGIVFINGKELILPDRAKPQYSYKVTLDPKSTTDFDAVFKDLNITDGYGFETADRDSLTIRALTFENAEKLKTISGITSIKRNIRKGRENGIFPCKHHDGADENKIAWSGDNYGPIYIPQAGKTVALTLESLPFYKIIIKEYEGNKLKVVGNDIYINDKIATTYTFKQNYYWMMGDNRHNSLDARYFGYTPEDHIVGKPIFIWMSWDSNGKGIMNKIRWERLFTTVSGEGQPQSYFKYFLFLLAAYFVGEYFWTKRKAKKTE